MVWERGLSAKTVEAYRGDIARFADWLRKGSESGPDWAAADPSAVAGFLESGAGATRLSAATRARRLAAIRGFFAFLKGEGIVRANPAATLSTPRRPRQLPRSLSESQAARLMEAPPLGSAEGLRDRALLELVYGCGLRVAEAADMTVDAVRFDAGVVRVLGKGSKVRHVPLGAKAEEALRRYLAESRPALGAEPGEPALFLSRSGKPLTRQAVWRMLKRRAAEAGVTAAVSPHWLRHSFATHMLQRGAPVRVIQELLGHADISTTQIYTHADAARLSAAVRTCHPRA